MKKRTKISLVLSSAAAILLAGSIMAGGTYALFTSESKTNIAVSSGTVNVSATVEGLQTYSGKDLTGEAEADASKIYKTNSTELGGTNGTFTNGGTAKYENGTLTLDKMTPGDKVTFTIKVTNYSNVKVKYRTKFVKTEDTGLFSGLKFKIGETSNQYITDWSTLNPAEDTVNGTTVATYECSVELPSDKGDEYQEKSCKIAYTVEAIQGNAQHSDAVIVTSDNIPSSFKANTEYFFMAGNYGNQNFVIYKAENVSLIGNTGVKFDSLQISSIDYVNSSLGQEVNLDNSTLTVKGFEVANTLTIVESDKNVVVEENTAAQITVKTNVSSQNIVVKNNNITGGNGADQKYGVYVVPNVTDYDLTVTSNTFTNIVKHAIAVQGTGDGSAVTAAKSITVTGNTFTSYGTRVLSDTSKNGAAFKIWADTKYAPASNAELTEAAELLVKAIKDNNTFSDKMKEDATHYFLADIFDTMVGFN